MYQKRRLIVLIRFLYSQKTKNYTAYLENIDLYRDIKIPVKFDTGAIATIFTTKALGLNKEGEKVIANRIEQKAMIKKNFTSATGHTFYGYPCYCDNIRLDDVILRRFYYYLVLDGSRSKALIGDDFISCCTFSHGYESDIVVTGFNAEKYEKKCMLRAMALNIFEILSLEGKL